MADRVTLPIDPGDRPVRGRASRRATTWVGTMGAVSLGAALAVALHPRRVVVTGSSMAPALVAGDRLLVLRLPRLAPGDVVALRDPRDRRRLLVKRVSSVVGSAVVVHGDNPGASTDSREFGPVDRSDIVGTVLRRYGPPGRAGPVP